jgi:CelD/BcsL family acetyltransferase involved in cellulose biosynthesis
MLQSSSFQLELIRDPERLYAMEEEWSQLSREDLFATPFQSPEWLLPWWKHFSEGELFVTAIREMGRLVALIPFYIYPHGTGGERQLLLLGAGTSDYQDGLFADRQHHSPLSMVAECLLAHDGLWDVAYLQQLRTGSPLLGLGDFIPHSQHYASATCSFLPAGRPNSLSAKLMRNISYYRHRAEQQGKLEFLQATQETALSLFELLIRFHQDRWESRGEPGVLSDRRVQQHHREAIPLFQRRGLLRLHALQLNEEVIGVQYGLADPFHYQERKIYYYLSGFHSDFGHLSPGTLLLASALETAQQEGAIAVDLLRGEEQYKKLWNAEFFPTYAIQFRSEPTAPKTISPNLHASQY